MVNMKVRPIANVPRSRARLGASEYRACAQRDPPRPRAGVTGPRTSSAPTSFDVSREDFPAVTAYNDSKALPHERRVRDSSSATFQETRCTPDRGKRRSLRHCSMHPSRTATRTSRTSDRASPPSARCATRSWATAQCATLRRHVAKEKQYDSMEVGLPCGAPGAPFAKAAYAQVSTRRRTPAGSSQPRRCAPLGHALWVQPGSVPGAPRRFAGAMASLIQLCENTARPGRERGHRGHKGTFYHPSQQQEENTPGIVGAHGPHAPHRGRRGGGVRGWVRRRYQARSQQSPARLVWWQQLWSPHHRRHGTAPSLPRDRLPSAHVLRQDVQTKKDAEGRRSISSSK